MSKKNYSKLLQKVNIHNLNNNRAEALRILEEYLANNDPTIELKERHAFLLYHYAFEILQKKDNSDADRKKAENCLETAIKICNSLIDDDPDLSTNYAFNANLFLAQIYAFQGRYKLALQIAKENFSRKKNAIAANRVANVLCIIKKKDKDKTSKKEILQWVERYKLLAEKEGCPEKPFLLADLAIFYKHVNEIEQASIYFNKAIKSLPDDMQGRSMKSILKENFTT